jgi:ubiquinone/menaquinone biosynthesis C-methylase UbiE/DNA-binding HxlR family transcriptional regulator
MQEIAEQLRVLGDETRLRILRLLLEESLNVGELTSILGLAQPTVSKHLAELRKAGLVEVVRAAGYSYYRIPLQLSEWWDALSSSLARRTDEHNDLVRLQELLKQREELSDVPDRFVVPGRSWLAWSRALGLLLSPARVADFGCGDGLLSFQMSGWAGEVIAIDCNPAFLGMAREKYSSAENILFLERDMECTSLPEKSVDLVVISQSLHYAIDPPAVLREAFRILDAGGRVLILELFPHSERWVISQLGHRWLGFEPGTLAEWLSQAGFRGILTESNWRHGSEPFRVMILAATKEEAKP